MPQHWLTELAAIVEQLISMAEVRGADLRRRTHTIPIPMNSPLLQQQPVKSIVCHRYKASAFHWRMNRARKNWQLSTSKIVSASAPWPRENIACLAKANGSSPAATSNPFVQKITCTPPTTSPSSPTCRHRLGTQKGSGTNNQKARRVLRTIGARPLF